MDRLTSDEVATDLSIAWLHQITDGAAPRRVPMSGELEAIKGCQNEQGSDCERMDRDDV